MTKLAGYLGKYRGRTSELARRLGVGPGTLSSIKSGDRKPSADLAKRIESATGGEVSAASLLGLEESTTRFERSTATPLGDGRWSVLLNPDGSAILPPEMVRSLGFETGDRLLFEVQGERVGITSARRALRMAQAEFNRGVPSNVDVVDDFLKDRRAEALDE